MDTKNLEQNLLVGILAIQLDILTPTQLTGAVQRWMQQEACTLDQLLIENQLIDASVRELLLALASKHLDANSRDPRRALHSLVTADSSLRKDLLSLEVPEIEASLDIPRSLATIGLSQSEHRQIGQEQASGASRFRVLRPHAEGGLGKISIALDQELQREVALKEIHDQLADHSESRSRFVKEAEITGGLEHPGIVPVYGLGTFGNGRPYYAMRFIKGDSLKEAVDDFHRRNGSPPRDKFESVEFRQLLKRFVDVCQAIEYAHSRGVLHRDLKPGNIMLGKYGETMVVDWGLSKFINHKEPPQLNNEAYPQGHANSRSSDTAMGSAVGTPQYMSPEQAEGKLDCLGPASDVYSLGATMYYLLVGKSPFAKSDLKDVLRSVARGDFVRPRQINPRLPVSLEAVCQKAMSLKVVDRYQTPQLLANDIERYLADEPVSAHVDSLSTSLRRWMRKRPRMVTSMVVSLLVGITAVCIASTIVWNKNQLLNKANLAESTAREEAERNLAYARKGNEILGSVFIDLDPSAKYTTVSDLRNALRDKLSRARSELNEFTIGSPLDVARIQNTLGLSFLGLGSSEEAAELFSMAYATRSSLLGKEHPDSLVSLNGMASAQHSIGNFSRSIELFTNSIELRSMVLGRRNEDTLISINGLAASYYESGNIEEAVRLWSESAAIASDLLGNRHFRTLTSQSNLAVGYLALGRLDEAQELLDSTVKTMMDALGPEHPQTLRGLNNLALAFQMLGQQDQAVEQWQKLLTIQSAHLGRKHPDTLITLLNVSMGLLDLGRLEVALPMLKESYETSAVVLEATDPTVSMSLNNLGDGYQRVGQLDDSIKCFSGALELRESNLGVNHSDTLISAYNLADCYVQARQLDKALPLMQRVAAGCEKNEFKNQFAEKMIEAIIKFFESQDQHEIAEQWQQKWQIHIQKNPTASPLVN